MFLGWRGSMGFVGFHGHCNLTKGKKRGNYWFGALFYGIFINDVTQGGGGGCSELVYTVVNRLLAILCYSIGLQ